MFNPSHSTSFLAYLTAISSARVAALWVFSKRESFSDEAANSMSFGAHPCNHIGIMLTGGNGEDEHLLSLSKLLEKVILTSS